MVCTRIDAAGHFAEAIEYSVAVEHLHQVPAELGFHRTMYDFQRLFENDLVDGTHHLARAHLAQVTTPFLRGAGRVFPGQHIEGFAGGDALFQLSSLSFGLDQDVTGHGDGHVELQKADGWALCLTRVPDGSAAGTR